VVAIPERQPGRPAIRREWAWGGLALFEW